MYSSSENFWKVYIWIMCKVTLVAIQMHQTYVLFLRMFVCVDASHHKTTCHNIKLTDMWYLDISSLALTYIYLSRTNNNFWHWSAQEELKPSQILWLIFLKKIIGRKNYRTFFPGVIAPKKWFLDRINSVPGRPDAIVFAGLPIGHKCITTAIFNCSCSMNFYNGFWGSTT